MLFQFADCTFRMGGQRTETLFPLGKTYTKTKNDLSLTSVVVIAIPLE